MKQFEHQYLSKIQVALFLVLAMIVQARSQTFEKLEITNAFYATLGPDSLWTRDAEKRLIVDSRLLDASRSNAQCQAAAMDEAGNWGSPVAGFQVSLRLNKKFYEPGEPLVATIILRNVAERELEMPDIFGEPYDFHFEMKTGDARRLPSLPIPDSRGGLGGRIQVPERTQRKFEVRLDRQYPPITNGSYEVSVRMRVPNLVGTGLTNTASGWATFRILTEADKRPSGSTTNVSHQH